MAKTLIRNVYVGGTGYGPIFGNETAVPNNVAAQITNPHAWALNASSQAAMLALSATVDDVVIRTDLATVWGPAGVFILTAAPASSLSNWTRLNPQAELSVDGTDIATQSELETALSALSGTYVPRVGDQTIFDTKTFQQPGAVNTPDLDQPSAIHVIGTKGPRAPVQIEYEGAGEWPDSLDRALSVAIRDENGDLFPFPGPIFNLMADGGIMSGGYVVVSGSPTEDVGDANEFSGFQNGTPVRSMVAFWMDTTPANGGEWASVLSLRNLAGYDTHAIQVIEDIAAAHVQGLIGRPGNFRWVVTQKGDTYAWLTAHTDQPMLATNYERAHMGWDVANSRYVIETQAGGTGVRRELLVKDRKDWAYASADTYNAAGDYTLGYWVAPRAGRIVSASGVIGGNLAQNGGTFCRLRLHKIEAGVLATPAVVDLGNDSVALSASVPFSLGTPDATTGAFVAGDVIRFFVTLVGTPTVPTPTIQMAWEPA